MSFSHFVSIKGQQLVKYEYYSGGGMTGGYHRETVKKYDDTSAVITTEKAEWHNDEPEITEYKVDIAIMDELEKIIRKQKMNFWHRKKFSNVFIADGESMGYTFTFDDAEIDFSSQHYPAQYRNKLQKLDETVDAYLKNAVLLTASDN